MFDSFTLDTLFQQNLIAVFQFDNQLKVKRFNQQLVNLLSSTPELISNFDFNKAYDQRIIPYLERTLKGEYAFYEGEYLPTTSNAHLNVRLELFPLYDNNKNNIGGIGFVRDLSTQAVQNVELDLKSAIEKAYQVTTIGIAIANETNRVIFANHLFEQITGYNIRDLSKLDLLELIQPEYQSLIREAFNLVKATGSPQLNFEIKILTKNHIEKWISCGFNLVTYNHDTYYLICISDISNHRWAEEELQIQKSFFESLFNVSPYAIVVLDTEDRVLQINKRFTELFGYTTNEAIGNFINDLIVPTHLKLEGSQLSNSVAAGKKITVETVRQTKDGKIIDVAITGLPIILGGSNLAIYGIYEDITQRKKLERLRNSIYEINSAIQTTLDLNELFARVHEILQNILDVKNFFIALVDKYRNDIYFPYACDEIDKDYPEVRISLQDSNSLTVEVIKSKQPLLLTERALKARFLESKVTTYGTVPLSWLGVPLIIGEEAIGAIVVQSYSIPNLYQEDDKQLLFSVAGQIAIAVERKISEIALRESEEKYRLLVESSRDGIVISQHDKFIYVNQAFAEMLGYTIEELNLIDYKSIHTEKALEILAERDARRQRGEDVPSQYETLFRKKDGSALEVEVNVTIIDYKGDKATFAIVRDISERKRVVAALLATADQSKALGDLIPICAACKKIRDDSHPEKPWVDPEIYISERLKNVNFTHGICPSCLKRLYPEYAKKKNIG
jgi:PAS domain S-box-containing protein